MSPTSWWLVTPSFADETLRTPATPRANRATARRANNDAGIMPWSFCEYRGKLKSVRRTSEKKLGPTTASIVWRRQRVGHSHTQKRKEKSVPLYSACKLKKQRVAQPIGQPIRQRHPDFSLRIWFVKAYLLPYLCRTDPGDRLTMAYAQHKLDSS